jgi:hypothetical protein
VEDIHDDGGRVPPAPAFRRRRQVIRVLAQDVLDPVHFHHPDVSLLPKVRLRCVRHEQTLPVHASREGLHRPQGGYRHLGAISRTKFSDTVSESS